mmetsp:Transcript_25190/g.65741  ORF Transcript_25190/g.65741 Transcript_25190/m.65741 type:complete len:244 (-) Transcript_25190:772-1503(-)
MFVDRRDAVVTRFLSAYSITWRRFLSRLRNFLAVAILAAPKLCRFISAWNSLKGSISTCSSGTPTDANGLSLSGLTCVDDRWCGWSGAGAASVGRSRRRVALVRPRPRRCCWPANAGTSSSLGNTSGVAGPSSTMLAGGCAGGWPNVSAVVQSASGAGAGRPCSTTSGCPPSGTTGRVASRKASSSASSSAGSPVPVEGRCGGCCTGWASVVCPEHDGVCSCSWPHGGSLAFSSASVAITNVS